LSLVDDFFFLSKVTIVLKYLHKTLTSVLPTFNGLSLIGGNWLRYLIGINYLPTNGTYMFSVNDSHNRESICMNNLGPMKLISSVKMYLTCFISSWNTPSAWTYKGLNSLIWILSIEWIVLARLLKKTIPVGVNNINGLFQSIEWELNSFEIQCIRYVFPIPLVL